LIKFPAITPLSLITLSKAFAQPNLNFRKTRIAWAIVTLLTIPGWSLERSSPFCASLEGRMNNLDAAYALIECSLQHRNVERAYAIFTGLLPDHQPGSYDYCIASNNLLVAISKAPRTTQHEDMMGNLMRRCADFGQDSEYIQWERGKALFERRQYASARKYFQRIVTFYQKSTHFQESINYFTACADHVDGSTEPIAVANTTFTVVSSALIMARREFQAQNYASAQPLFQKASQGNIWEATEARFKDAMCSERLGRTEEADTKFKTFYRTYAFSDRLVSDALAYHAEFLARTGKKILIYGVLAEMEFIQSDFPNPEALRKVRVMLDLPPRAAGTP
jgi:tetratricopeptide (TPR) repeat protein